MTLTDAHCHLRGQVEEVIRRCEAEGMRMVLTSGITLDSSAEAVKLAEQYDCVHACIGIHPWHADEFADDSLDALRTLASGSAVVAISEIGLDFVRLDASKAVQERVFREQIRLANELGLPVIFHDREAHSEVIAALRDEGVPGLRGAIHGFSGDPDLARQFMDLGLFISIGKRGIESPENDSLLEAIETIPTDRLLIETDSPEPTGVRVVAEKIAEVKGTSVDTVAACTYANLCRLLRISV